MGITTIVEVLPVGHSGKEVLVCWHVGDDEMWAYHSVKDGSLVMLLSANNADRVPAIPVDVATDVWDNLLVDYMQNRPESAQIRPLSDVLHSAGAIA